MFKSVDPKPNFPQVEQEILKFWEEKKIFEQLQAQTKSGQPFVFFEGPPTANGKPHIGHVITRAYKDVILRFQTMLGKRVVRKAGWDTHGLPVELEVEKALGISGKRDIENLVAGDSAASIEKFNTLCRESVWKYKAEWEQFTARVGFWLDLKDPYVTYENRYIESVWWVFQQISKRQVDGQPLLYQGHKVLPYCPRCGTGLSSHEVAQGYRSVQEDSVFVRFRLTNRRLEVKNKNGEPVVIELDKPTYLLSWTTTPWTLPGNVALAAGEKIDYSLVTIRNEINYIVATKLLGSVFPGETPVVLENFAGRDLAGVAYTPIFDVPQLQSPKSYTVYLADFVTTDNGTGLVHTAVMYGEDDYQLGNRVGLPKFHTVTEEGKFIDSLQKLGGHPVKDPKTEHLIFELLKKNDAYVATVPYVHDYPYCWRCGTALLYYARDSWFIRMSALKAELIANNEQINWVPEYIKHGRFGEWLADIKDWAVSRERYWGTPMPVWVCGNDQCGNIAVIGSLTELVERSFDPMPQDFDLHRPHIDAIHFKCERCGDKMARVPQVLDVWFDSGAVPFAQWHYPYENKDLIPEPERLSAQPLSAGQFPADYISEAIDQTRGWFYVLLAEATALGYRVPPYRNVINLGHILDEQGKKMSKSKGNVIDPMSLANEYGMDIVRWYMYTVNQPGDTKRFSVHDLVTMQRRVQAILWNVYNYFVTYAGANKWPYKPAAGNTAPAEPNVLDLWIQAELQSLIAAVSGGMARYDVFRSARMLEEFITNLSTWYLRRSRGRSDGEFFSTLSQVLLSLTRLLAPFMPFITDAIYRNIRAEGSPDSVHLAPWPQQRALTEQEIRVSKDMAAVRGIVESVLAWRKSKSIKVRQPLSDLYVITADASLSAYISIMSDELNFLNVSVPAVPPAETRGLEKISVSGLPDIFINPELTDELRYRGLARDLERLVQELRKTSGLRVGQEVELYYETTDQAVYEAFEYFDQGKTYVTRVIGARENVDFFQDITIEPHKVWIGLRKTK